MPNWVPPELPRAQIVDAKNFLASRAPRGKSDNKLTLTTSTALRGAVENGKITFLSPNGRNVFLQINEGNFNFEGHEVRFSQELAQLLLTLANTGGAQIMRTFGGRDAKTGKLQGAHTGDLVRGIYVCGAADITSYAGRNFNFLQSKERLIDAVLTLLRNLPTAAKYDLGFPRPVGGRPSIAPNGTPIGFDPSKDVFYPITTLSQANAGFNGDHRPLIEMYDPPRSQVMAALAGKQKGFTYADAADHFHIKAYS